MSKRIIRGLISTIILSVLLAIALILAYTLLNINLSESLAQMSQSAGESIEGIENPGEMSLVVMLALGIGVTAVVIAAYMVAILTFLFSSLPLIFSIRNVIKVKFKPLRIVNIVYTALFASISILSIVKMLLFFTGIG